MRAGRLRQRVVVQKYTESADSFGQPIQTWTNWVTVWAAVEPLRGDEYMQARQLEAQETTRIRIRWRSGVTERQRVTWTDPGAVAHVFEVGSVIEDATHRREIVLMCREVE